MESLGRVLTNPYSPDLFVFDLDYTLWPFWCDTHVVAPFTKHTADDVTDKYGYRIHLYADVRTILTEIKSKGKLIAAASRTHAPPIARELLQLMEIDHLFDYKQIYPGSKRKHFAAISSESGIGYNQMVFYDDEPRNISEINKLGVTCHLVEDGLNMSDLVTSLTNFTHKTKHP